MEVLETLELDILKMEFLIAIVEANDKKLPRFRSLSRKFPTSA